MTTDERKGDWCQVYSGAAFWPLDPRPEEIDIVDIAHALANQCRFGGHCERFYSVAQHCVLVSHVCDEADALWGLLHDAAEAYLVDVPRPIKRSLGGYGAIERQLEIVIAERFGLPSAIPPSVRHADEVLLATEARDLMKRHPRAWMPMPPPMAAVILPWAPEKAERRFHERVVDLQIQPPRLGPVSP